MVAVSLRLPDDLERKLSQEASLSGQPRSQLIREALENLLSRRERERVVAAMVAAAKVLAADPDALVEARAVAADFFPAENEALALAEGHAPGTGGKGAQDERWWH
jgi:metal-responsive CopG/Arc/MetJ family transcriptional regulator